MAMISPLDRAASGTRPASMIPNRPRIPFIVVLALVLAHADSKLVAQVPEIIREIGKATDMVRTDSIEILGHGCFAGRGVHRHEACSRPRIWTTPPRSTDASVAPEN
jgi:hypothetical protein